ncbi:hypothetical protein BZG36_04518 [Bifiguratus adelaidae]|uniref:Uncharacterized protein n=1 Tax=Bifiguratus adelaidae TaxID=1938954 RepID=A0A261XX94_9FUNG|nr:hypothetical protein BZG36_04518 [Bifiguratus adelaidae]
MFCLPPLRSVTWWDSGDEVNFQVFGEHACHVEVWNNLNKRREWGGIPLRPVTEKQEVVGVKGRALSAYRGTIRLEDVGPGWYEFTIRYTCKQEEDWTWLSDGGRDNGKVFVRKSTRMDLREVQWDDLFSGTSTKLLTENIAFDDNNQYKLWQIRHHFQDVPRNSTEYSIPIGAPKGLVQYAGLRRHNTQVDAFIALFHHLMLAVGRRGCFPSLVTMCRYVILIPITTSGINTYLRSDFDGCLYFHVKPDYDRPEGGARFILALIENDVDPQQVIGQMMRYIVTHVLQAQMPLENDAPSSVFMHRLGYCTWNAFMFDISEANLLKTVESLKKHEVPVGYLIIDDGWLTLKNGRLAAFEADPEKFPNGLAHAISLARKTLPSIQKVGIWHTLWGYWSGTSLDSDMAKYDPIDISNTGLIPAHGVEQFYEDFYAFLHDAGVELVKVDNQAALDKIDWGVYEEMQGKPTSPLWILYQSALAKATNKHFDNHIVYCMALTPRYFFDVFSHMDRDPHQPKAMLRNTDDFFPNIPQSHAWHIYTNAMCTLLTSAFPNFILDWDMFETRHAFGDFHAASRAISGGPVYITDHPDKHNETVVRGLVAQNSSGEWLLLRSEHPPRLSPSCIFNDAREESPLFKFYNQNNDWRVLAVYNLHSIPKLHAITPDDVGIIGGQDFAIYFFNDASTWSTLRRAKCVLLEERGWELVTFAPLSHHVLHSVDGNNAPSIKVSLACLGLVDKYNGTQPIREANINLPAQGKIIMQVNLQTISANLAFYVSLKYESMVELSARFYGNDIPQSRIHWDKEKELVIVDVVGIAMEGKDNFVIELCLNRKRMDV